MRLVTQIIAMSRAMRLGRQLREIEAIVTPLNHATRQKLALLTMRELAQAGRSEFPHLYGTPVDARYTLWGSGTDTGLERAHSDNPQVRLRGVALWLAVAFHETRDSQQSQLAAVHRHVLGLLRQLKQAVPADLNAAQWTDRAEAAA